MRSLRALTPAAYVLFAMLVLFPLSEVLLEIGAPRPGDANWRYGAVGFLSRALMTPLLGVGLASALALGNHHLRTARTLAIVSLTLTGLFILVAGLFTLDAIQLQASLDPSLRGSFFAASVQALLKFLFAAVLTGLLGRGLWRAGARMAKESPGPASGVVFGQGSEGAKDGSGGS